MATSQKIAIDIGYGDTKVCFLGADGKLVTFKFPSAVAKVKESQSSFGDDAMTDSYLFNGKRYFVGEKAKDSAVSTRGYGFLSNFAPIIAYHAIIKAGFNISQPIELVTGLSIMNWKEVDQFEEIMSTINVNDVVIKPALTLMAQGQGVLRDYSGDTSGKVCVVDIGYNTFDFLVFEDGEPRKDLSYADPIGANKIITDLQAILKRQFDTPFTEIEAKEIFVNGFAMNFGRKHDFSDTIKDLKEDYTAFIMDELSTKSKKILSESTSVIFSGGGAYFMQQDELPENAEFSEVPFEFGNVRGYFKSIAQG